MRREHTDLITIASDLEQILAAFRDYRPPSRRWFRGLAQA
jgi:hypothetical protein